MIVIGSVDIIYYGIIIGITLDVVWSSLLFWLVRSVGHATSQSDNGGNGPQYSNIHMRVRMHVSFVRLLSLCIALLSSRLDVAFLGGDFGLTGPHLAAVHLYLTSPTRSGVAGVIDLHPGGLGNDADLLVGNRLDLLAIDGDLGGHWSTRQTSILFRAGVRVFKGTLQRIAEEIQGCICADRLCCGRRNHHKRRRPSSDPAEE